MPGGGKCMQIVARRAICGPRQGRPLRGSRRATEYRLGRPLEQSRKAGRPGQEATGSIGADPLLVVHHHGPAEDRRGGAALVAVAVPDAVVDRVQILGGERPRVLGSNPPEHRLTSVRRRSCSAHLTRRCLCLPPGVPRTSFRPPFLRQGPAAEASASVRRPARRTFRGPVPPSLATTKSSW